LESKASSKSYKSPELESKSSNKSYQSPETETKVSNKSYKSPELESKASNKSNRSTTPDLDTNKSNKSNRSLTPEISNKINDVEFSASNSSSTEDSKKTKISDLEEHTEEDKQEILQIYQDLVKQRELEDIIQREKMAQEWSETKGVSKKQK